MNKWSLLLLIPAFLILGISLNVQQHSNKQNVKPTHEERAEVVEETEEASGGNVVVREPEQPSEQGVGQNSQTDEITAYIKKIWGDNADFGIALAKCESSLNPNAVSPSGKYVGLYQFDKLTFDSNCVGVREEWKDQVVCAYELIQKGQYSRWPNCP